MATISDYFEQAQLSTAAYALGLQPGMFGAIDYPTYVTALKNAGMSPSQAIEFANTYSVVDQFTDTLTGFSGTVFADQAGIKYFAIRGTEGFSFSGAIDWLTNVADVGADGIAINQGVAMFNWLQRLYGSAGNPVVQYVYNSNTRAMEISSEVINATGYLSASLSPISVTGHSLGGHLAMMLSRLAPNLISNVYTYNAPGFDTLLRTNLFPLTSEGFFDALINAPIGPITGQIGTDWSGEAMTHFNVPGDIVHIIGDTPGNTPLTIFSETANEGPIDAHDISAITDSLAVYNLFATVAPNIQVSTVTNILEAASYTRNTSDTTDETLETALDALRVFVSDFQQATSTTTVIPTIRDNRDNFYTNFTNLQTEIKNLSLYNETSKSLGLSVASLVGADTGVLFNNAKQYDSVRYALTKLNPFTITGNPALYDQINFDGSLDLYDSTTRTGTQTDQYLQDRSAFLSNKILSGSANTATDSGDAFVAYAGAPQVFEDLNTDPGYKLYLGADASVSSIPVDEMSRIRFGSAGDNQLFGSPEGDRFYGMGGDDTLTGGQGEDYLEGGVGSDTYVYNFGDGFDTILDTDGLGNIVYRDEQGIEYTLTGGTRTSAGGSTT